MAKRTKNQSDQNRYRHGQDAHRTVCWHRLRRARALIAAASNLQSDDTKTAKAELQWVLDNSKEEGMKALAALHLAGVLLDENNPAAALALLDAPHEEAFADLFSDRKGDALVMQNKRDEARAAYKIALEKLPENSPYRKVVEIKLNAIAGVAAK
ncbi:hypothetical protein CAP31_10220 [Sulfuriferula sp. AH1]|nr:hypothetical protein CAP31_10220 [Sulfuriferula sp. AH1]